MTSFLESVSEAEEIQQGNIFKNLPFVKISDNDIVEIKSEGKKILHKKIDLLEYSATGKDEKNVLVPVEILPAIIISQNCDILRSNSNYISYCAIRKFEEVEKNFSPKGERQVEFLTVSYASKLKYFYLPADLPFGFSERMAVDFSSIHQLSREVMQQLIKNRQCKLGEIPFDSFREKLAHYFWRFAYSPWYILNKKEFELYKSGLESEEQIRTPPFSWQE